MGLLGAERGQSVQIGAVLLFGILVIFLATYQAFVVPSQNEKVEFKHSERVQSQLQDLRNAVVSSASRESAKSVAVDLGTTYPARIVALNPPPSSGTLRTVGTSNGSVALAIDNATAVEAETRDFWNGTERGYSTGLLTYDPDYNLLQQMPTTVYGNTVLYNAFGQKSLPITGQTMIDGNELSLFVLNGSLNAGGSGTETVDVRPVSASEQSILVEPESGTANMTISFPSQLSAERWRSLLENEMNQSVDDERYVERIQGSDGPGEFNNITITLEADADYRMRMAKIGVGNNVESEDAAYLTVVDGAEASVESGGTTQVTLEVRDEYNNPVSSVRVNASASGGGFANTQKYSDVNGEVTFTYDATGVTGGTTQQLDFSLSVVPDSNFDPSTAENVTTSLSIAQQGGGQDPAYTVSFDTGRMETYTGLTCTPTSCTYDASEDSDPTFNLTALSNPSVTGASVDFALNTTEYGSLVPEDGTTSDSGRANATFGPTADGNITAFVASGGSSDSLPIRLVNTNASSGFQSSSATDLLPDISLQGQSFTFTPATDIPDGTRIHINLDDPQQLSPLQVAYQHGAVGASISTSNTDANTDGNTAYVNITTGEQVSAGETVRVWTREIRTGGDGQYDVSITREDTNETVTTSFEVGRNTGGAEISNFDATDLVPNTEEQQQTFTFTFDTAVPGGERVAIGLSPAQGSNDVLYQGLSSVNVTTEDTNFNVEDGDAWVTFRAPSGGYDAGDGVAVTVNANTGEMANAPYEIGISRDDAGTTSTTFGTKSAGQVSYNSDVTTIQGGTGIEFSISNDGSSEVTVTEISVDTDDNNINYVWEGNSGTGAQNREVFLNGVNDDGYLETGDSESTDDTYSTGTRVSLTNDLTLDGDNTATITVYEFIKQFTGSGVNDRDVSGQQVTVVLTFSDESTKTIRFTP